MSNRQADTLRLDALASDRAGQAYLTLKPARLAAKKIKKLHEGDLLDGLDPLHLRIIRDGQILARAKLGQIGGREAVHIVDTDPEPIDDTVLPKYVRIDVRLRLLTSSDDLAVGDVLEHDDPLSRSVVILADNAPLAIGEMVDYDGEAMIRVMRILHG